MQHWLIDQSLDLVYVCERFGWDRTRCIAALTERQFQMLDAVAFVDFAFSKREYPDGGAESQLSKLQWSRLRVDSIAWSHRAE